MLKGSDIQQLQIWWLLIIFSIYTVLFNKHNKGKYTTEVCYIWQTTSLNADNVLWDF